MQNMDKERVNISSAYQDTIVLERMFKNISIASLNDVYELAQMSQTITDKLNALHEQMKGN